MDAKRSPLVKLHHLVIEDKNERHFTRKWTGTGKPAARESAYPVSSVVCSRARALLLLLKGLLGRGEAENIWRLYLTLEMDEYVEFASSDVVHSQAVNESDSLAGTSVWVRRGTTLRYTHVASRQVQADFLRGDITARHLGRTRLVSFRTGLGGGNWICLHKKLCLLDQSAYSRMPRAH